MQHMLRAEGLANVRHLGSFREIAEWTERYFAHYGISIAEEQLVVRFFFYNFKPKRQINRNGRRRPISGQCEFPSAHEVEVVLFHCSNESRRNLLRAFYHELDHVRWAIERGRGDFARWGDRRYRRRPHERRAFRTERVWTRRHLWHEFRTLLRLLGGVTPADE